MNDGILLRVSRGVARLSLAAALLAGQEIPAAEAPGIYALTGARVVVAPGRVLQTGTVVIREGLIEAVGERLEPPGDAYVLDLPGMTITAGFLDACSDIGQKRPDAPAQPGEGRAGGPGRGAAQTEPPPGAGHPLARVRPERRVVDLLATDASSFEKHRAMGFTAALSLPGEGIFRGQAALLDLGAGPTPRNVVRSSAGQVVALERGRSGEPYPNSLMGSIAAIRQTLLDAGRNAVWAQRWAASPAGIPRPEFLAAFGPLVEAIEGRSSVIFDVRESADVPRALAIAREFGLKAIVIASGLEAAEPGAVDLLRAAGHPVILPLAYPDKPKVEDPDEALNVSLRDLERWDVAPANPARLHDAGVAFALGTCRLASPTEFPANLRKAIARGLTPDAALAALTINPARFLGVADLAGSVEAGKAANLVAFEGPAGGPEGIFGEKVRAAHVFVDGVKHDVERKSSKGDPDAKVDPRGTWSVTFTSGGRTVTRTWTIRGREGSYSGTAETQAGLVELSSVKLAGNEMTVVLPPQEGRQSQEIVVVISGEQLEGSGEGRGGGSFAVKGRRISGPEGGRP